VRGVDGTEEGIRAAVEDDSNEPLRERFEREFYEPMQARRDERHRRESEPKEDDEEPKIVSDTLNDIRGFLSTIYEKGGFRLDRSVTASGERKVKSTFKSSAVEISRTIQRSLLAVQNQILADRALLLYILLYQVPLKRWKVH
jgi:hypothetical protein